ncbi:MAG: diguanylate cyclase [Nitrospinae bacterium]|nr:diguanylate cyclase [Nitrospinota bacterium]
MNSENKQRILIVDDERLNREILSNLLQETHNIVVAKSGEQALKRLENNSDIDLVLLDVMMPDMDGYETIKCIKENDNLKDIPVIFITALDSADDEEKGLQLGAADYIAKPFRPAIVRLRVANHLQFIRQRKILELLAGKDGLTEIANRRTFDETYKKEWLRASRNGLPLSVAMIDVDFFKHFNDNYGHAKGDVALKAVASTLQKSLRRSSDLVARYGGEEFVLLLPETSKVEGESFLNTICSKIQELAIPHEFSEVSPHLSISVGGATTTSHKNPEDFLKEADLMLYKAKDSGRNQVVWCD